MSGFNVVVIWAMLAGSVVSASELLYVHRLEGELAACGCSMAPVGGLPRISALQTQIAKTEKPLTFFGGPVYSPIKTASPIELSSKKRKLEIEFELLAEIPPAAVFPWDKDFDYPISLVVPLAKKFGVPLVATNLKFKSVEIPRYLRTGDTLILGVGSESGGRTNDGVWEEPGGAIARALAEQKIAPKLVVLLTDFSIAEKRKLAATISIPHVWLGGDDILAPNHLGKLSENAIHGVISAQGHSALQVTIADGADAKFCSDSESSGCRRFEMREHTLDAKFEVDNLLKQKVKGYAGLL